MNWKQIYTTLNRPNRLEITAIIWYRIEAREKIRTTISSWPFYKPGRSLSYASYMLIFTFILTAYTAITWFIAIHISPDLGALLVLAQMASMLLIYLLKPYLYLREYIMS